MKRRAGALAAGMLVALAGCGGDIIHGNPPLGPGGAHPGLAYDYETLSRHTDPASNSEQILVILALSGGGTRAAALAFGVLEQLHATMIQVPGGRPARSVLQEVDVISSNSGGSFVAAYYTVHRDEMFASDGTATRFERDFLKHDVTRDLLRRTIAELPRIGTPAVNRSDVAAEYYDRQLRLGNVTYGQLVAKGRPYLLVNAQDTTKRARFVFTQGQFNLICSDLSPFPLSRAVTASSAFHGVFAPIKLRNHPLERCPPEPAWIARALNGEGGDPTSLIDSPRERLARARLARWYREKLPDDLRPPTGAEFFVHLADGGAADNSALRAPIYLLASRDSVTGLRRRIESGRVSAVLLIAVNAAIAADPLRDTEPEGPTITRMVQDAADGLVRTASEDSLREGAYAFALLREGARRRGQRTRFYGPVMIEFEAVEDPALRACLKQIPTRLDLPAPTVDALRLVGREQVANNESFQRFLAAYRGAVGRQPPPLPAANQFCPERRGRPVAAAP